jgi:hypothetical protein
VVIRKKIIIPDLTEDKNCLLTGIVQISANTLTGGCPEPGCGCQPGHWIRVTSPISSKGIIDITTILFDSIEELNELLTTRTAIAKPEEILKMPPEDFIIH